MKLFFAIFVTNSIFALAGKLRPNPLAERGMELSGNHKKKGKNERVGNQNEFAIWDECVYVTERVQSANGRYQQTRHQCQLPKQDFAHQKIASFHIQPAMRSDRDKFWCYESWEKHADLPPDEDGNIPIYPTIHCDSRMEEGYAIVHMLCCVCEDYISESFGKQLPDGTVVNLNGSVHEYPVGNYEGPVAEA
eukprot:scaffold34644_cov283-Amphora_coffeaeformis.AAC.3